MTTDDRSTLDPVARDAVARQAEGSDPATRETEASHPGEHDDALAIVREAERRIQARYAVASPARDAAARLNRGVLFLASHWIALFNLLMVVHLSGAILAPVAMHLGRTRIGGALYALYGPFCHQYPFRSWFLFGEAAAYPLHEPISALDMSELSHFVGNPEVGYKMALCQRDIAIYAAMLFAGLIYGPLRTRVKIPPLPLWLYFVFGILPMFLDGGIQWLSYALWQFIPALLSQPFETIPAMRTLTGALFGLGVTAVGYPTLAIYFDDIRATLKQKYGW